MTADDTVLVLQHQPDAGPGNVVAHLDRLGVPHRVVDATGALPAPQRHRALVVLGSRESSYDPDVPWIVPEREFMTATMATGTPVLGICFGAQQLCTVLGGSVHRMPRPEIGWTDVEGEAPLGGTWFSWHQDVMDLPAGVTTLASTPLSPHAFRAGPHLGVQFHPEMTRETLADWSHQLRRTELVAQAGLDPAVVLDTSPARTTAAHDAAGRLYEQFLHPPHDRSSP